MHKRLYTLLVLLLLPIFLVACEEHGAGSKVDPEVMAATLQKAMDTAETVENLNLRAYGLAMAGTELADINTARAREVLETALQTINEVRSDKNTAVIEELRTVIADWPAAEQEQVAGAVDRIEVAASRVWIIRAVAEGVMKFDRPAAMALLNNAAYAASREPIAKYRDLDLRSCATLMAGMDLAAAQGIASQIQDPRMLSWALAEIGSAAAASGSSDAEDIINKAATAARAIPDNVTAESALLTDESSKETVDMVLGAESAMITASSARALSGAALAMSKVNPSAATRMFKEASDVASGIDGKKYPYTRAYAMSDVAMDYAEVSPSGAMAMADSIDHDDAKFAAMLKAIKVKAATSGGSSILTDISKAETVAENIEDEFEEAKALEALALVAVQFDKGTAVDIASKIERELGHATYAYADIKNNVLAAVARAWSSEDADMAKTILEPTPEQLAAEHGKYIEVPRFANADVMYVKALAYTTMAEDMAATDPAAAAKLYGKAAGNANEAKSSQLKWRIAEGLCKLNSDNLMDYAAKIEDGDFTSKAMAMSAVAADWSAKGNPNSGMVWDIAAKSANMLGDNLESSQLLNKVAASCAAHNSAKAEQILDMSIARANKIGMKEEG